MCLPSAPAHFRSAVLLFVSSILGAHAAEVRVGDAFAIADSKAGTWMIGTASIEQQFEQRGDVFRLRSLKNRLGNSPREYIAAEGGSSFGIDVKLPQSALAFETLWKGRVEPGNPVGPQGGGIEHRVRKGEKIAFSVRSPTDAAQTHIDWPAVISLANGAVYRSAGETIPGPASVWTYAVQHDSRPDLVALERIDRGASGLETPILSATGFRNPQDAPRANGARFVLPNAHTEKYRLLRIWESPSDGMLSIEGSAELLVGKGADLEIVRLRDVPTSPPRVSSSNWKVTGSEVARINAGGRPAVQLTLAVESAALHARVRIVAYPGTSIVRHWVTFRNAGSAPLVLKSPSGFVLDLADEALADGTHLWMVGGNSKPTAGELRSSEVENSYHRTLHGRATDEYVSWTAFKRDQGAGDDGWFATLDFLGVWQMDFTRSAEGPGRFAVSVPELLDYKLEPQAELDLPVVTFGTFTRSLDDMGERLYRWQYEYMWDYTNPDYYARPIWITPWFYCSQNLQEQFAARLGNLGMDADFTRYMGFETLWDDAGWSKYPTWPVPDGYGNVFKPTYEGPDFAQTLRYYQKMDLRWILWFAGRPNGGLMDTKVGSWGDFQFRTDAVGRFDLAGDWAYRDLIEGFLTRNPKSSFHTCNGGSRYAHQFEIQRLADVNYFSDGGRGDETNYYMSYLDTPDKWVDILEAVYSKDRRYNPKTARGQLSMLPCWYAFLDERDHEALRKDLEIYRYLLHTGVAGRWSFMFHPAVIGDDEIYYMQRTSFDRKRACIIIRRQPETEVLIRPVELLPDHEYVVGLESTKVVEKRLGSELMKNGIRLSRAEPGELVYLGLPHRPRSGTDENPPRAPGPAFSRRETNLGHSGVSLFWSAGSDDRWVSGYQIQRNGTIIGNVRVGHYFFDHSAGFDPDAKYEVRTLDGDGNASEWRSATKLRGEPLTANALGGLFPEAGRDGWTAESSEDGIGFDLMKWVAPVKPSAADFGGTPNQVGGVEGYWESADGGRVGRGWQQASTTTAVARTWTAPASGRVRIIGRAFKDAYRQTLGDGLRVRIARNTEQIWPDRGWAPIALNDLVGAEHDVSVEVKAGDTLRFLVDRTADAEHAILGWMPRVVYHSPPDSTRAGAVVRILCGSERDHVDELGQRWMSDRYYTGGEPFRTDAKIDDAFPTRNDTMLYRNGRRGADFRYSIPVSPGLYSVRLKLAEPEHEWSFQRPFNVTVNGTPVLTNYDVSWIGRGPRRAHDKVLRFLVPNEEGRLNLHFTAGWEPVEGASGDALVQAIEVLPENSSEQAVRIDVGAADDFIDWSGFVWSGDAQKSLRLEAPATTTVAQASPTLYDQTLYRTAATGKAVRYAVEVAPGLYTVHLKFAELWLKGLGERPMDILINGRAYWTNWDAASAAGQINMAADLRARDVTPDAKGRIVIEVRATGANDAILQGLEIE